MTDDLALEKAKKYLLKLKNSKLIKKGTELIEIRKVIEQLDSISFQIKKERKNDNDFK